MNSATSPKPRAIKSEDTKVICEIEDQVESVTVSPAKSNKLNSGLREVLQIPPPWSMPPVVHIWIAGSSKVLTKTPSAEVRMAGNANGNLRR